MLEVARNIYDMDAPMPNESERLRSFDIPTRTSIDVIGRLNPNETLLDIGAGENPGLHRFAQESDADYLALDVRLDPLREHVAAGANVVQASAAELPVADNSIDVSHSRFVLAHLTEPEMRSKAISEAIRVVKPRGRAIFIDYDWTKMHGSDAINRMRDFTLSNIDIFDASYGSYSVDEISERVDANVQVSRTESPRLFDYRPALQLREVTVEALNRQGTGPDSIDAANNIFDDIKAEAVSDNPPGFYMPDIVAVSITKD